MSDNKEFRTSIGTSTVNFNDIDFTVVATIFPYYVEFAVYEIDGFMEGETKGVFDVPQWHKKGSDTAPDFVDTLDEAEIYLHGSVKWDGCSNWMFDEQERCMLHGCCRDDLINLGEIMARCWDLTAKLCPHWDNQ